jgi:hypothetical protein
MILGSWLNISGNHCCSDHWSRGSKVNERKVSLNLRTPTEFFMKDPEKIIGYRGHTIKLTPHEDRCSLFAMTILNGEGKEVKHSSRAGKNEDIAFENAKKMIDFDIEYEKQETEE